LGGSSPVGCFYLDTCVILSDILAENMARIGKLKNDSNIHNIPCYVSESAKKETYKKVQGTSDFLGNVVRDTMKYSLEEHRQRRKIPLTAPMTSDDMKVLERLFSHYHNAVRTTKVGLPRPVSLIEEWAIRYLAEKLDKGISVDIKQFLRELVGELLKLTSSFEDLCDDLLEYQKGYVKISKVTADPMTVAKLEIIRGMHDPDSVHLASAISHHNARKEKTVFVTLDYDTILRERDLIWKQFGLRCCDPLYAIYHAI